VAHIPIAVLHGRNGFPAAIGAVFPRSAAQTRIVRPIRDSLDSVRWKDCGVPPMPSGRAICQAATTEAADAALDAGAAGPRG
jgi:transposase-like protein